MMSAKVVISFEHDFRVVIHIDSRDIVMIKLLAPIAIALTVAACSTTSQTDRTLGGAAIGAGAGALIGAATGGGTSAALAGAAIGGMGGAVVGAATTPKNCVTRDAYGRRYRVACP